MGRGSPEAGPQGCKESDKIEAIVACRHVWPGAPGRKSRLGVRLTFCFFKLHQSIVSVCLEGEGVGGGEHTELSFRPKAMESWVTPSGSSVWRSAWNLLWCGGTMTWLVSGLLATCLPWVDCTTLNNPLSHHLTQSIS